MEKKQKTKESKQKNKFILPIAVVILVTILSITLAYNIKDTYSAGSYTVTFKSDRVDRTFLTCKTDTSGKLTNDCIMIVREIANRWSTISCDNLCGETHYTKYCVKTVETYNADICYKVRQGHDDQQKFSTSEVIYKTYTSNWTWYNVYNTSVEPSYNQVGCYECKNDSNIKKWGTPNTVDKLSGEKCTGGYKNISLARDSAKQSDCTTTKYCYVCKTDSNIMKWSTNGNGDTACSGGYSQNKNITEANCKTKTVTPTPTPTSACYVCKDNEKVMKWSTNGNGDDKCSAGYQKDTTKTTQDSCTPPNSACYVCKSDSNVMKWSTSGEADNKCSGGYNKDTAKTTQSSCVPPQKSCYVCKGNENIVKWDTNGNSDNKCTGGYNKTNASQANCVANPKTGTTGIAIAWFAAIFAMTFAYYYFKQTLAEQK